MSLAHITTMATIAKSRIVAQYRNAPNFVALIGAIAGVIQEVEDAYWDLFNAVLLDTATGIWLEFLGSIVGEGREGAVDVDYRKFIKARILANRSSGTVDQVLAIVAAIFGTATTATFESAVEYYPASMLLIIDSGLHPDAVYRNRMARIVAGARPVGIRLLINSNEALEAESFTCGDSDIGPLETPTIDEVVMQSAVGGALLGLTNYYYRVSAINALGETLASAEVFGTTDPGTNTNQLSITWLPVAHATGYRVYGRSAGAELRIVTLGVVLTYVDAGVIVPAGALPVANNTAQIDANRGFGDSGNPATGGKLSSGDLA